MGDRQTVSEEENNMQSNIKDKIAGLLALAESPNENEAKAALLKARELMVKYKLRPEEITTTEEAPVVQEDVGVTCTTLTNAWAANLGAIIADHYCCVCYSHHLPKAKKISLGFVGLEEDFEVCKQIFLYAYKYVLSRCKEIRTEILRIGGSQKEAREMCNSYGFGFCDGLTIAFQKQEVEHKAWGLVMAVPQAVRSAADNFTKRKRRSFGAPPELKAKGIAMFRAAGIADGREFDPSLSLPTTYEQAKTAN